MKKLINPYEVLGLNPDATDEDVQAAYRKMSLKHHPDRGGDPEEFKKVRDAYEILSNPDEREYYDKTGGTKDRDRDIESLIRGLINSAFEMESRDTIGVICDALDKKRSQCRAIMGTTQAAKRRVEKYRVRFANANKGTSNVRGRDFILNHLDAEIDAAQRSLDEGKDAIQKIEAALAYLNDLKNPPESQTYARDKPWNHATLMVGSQGPFRIGDISW